MRLWDVFNRSSSVEALHHVRHIRVAKRSSFSFAFTRISNLGCWCALQNADVLAVSFRPDGKEICTAALDGQLYFWDVSDASLKLVRQSSKPCSLRNFR